MDFCNLLELYNFRYSKLNRIVDVRKRERF